MEGNSEFWGILGVGIAGINRWTFSSIKSGKKVAYPSVLNAAAGDLAELFIFNFCEGALKCYLLMEVK